VRRLRQLTIYLAEEVVMFAQIRNSIFLICCIGFAASVFAQKTDHLLNQKEAIRQELDAIIAESRKVNPALANVQVRSKAAATLSLCDPAKAEEMFVEVWNFTLAQTDPDFDREQAINTILKDLFPKNAKLAKRLLNERLHDDISKDANKDKERSKLVRLSLELIDSDPSVASTYLEMGLSEGLNPAGLVALQRLRQRDPLLSDYVVNKTLDSVAAMRTSTTMSSLYLLSSYVFPESQSFAVPTGYESSLESLQYKYFATTYEVFKQSMAENETLVNQNAAPQNELKTRNLYQAQLSVILAALAPRYHPAVTNEINSVATKLMAQLPANLAQIAQFTASRLSYQTENIQNDELKITLAISNGNFQEASSQIDRLKSNDQREMYSQLLARVQAKVALSKGDVNEALTYIRRMPDSDPKLIMYMEAAKLARKKDQLDISRTIISETRALIPPSGRNGLHCRALLVFATQLARAGATQEAFELLDAGVLALNGLVAPSAEATTAQTNLAAAWTEINDPKSLITASELEVAFNILGVADLQLALSEATKINYKPTQLMARLAAMQDGLKRTKLSEPNRVLPKSTTVSSK
jgi:hypothetical protein